jgi:orotidine-5'-phosphate decarboxylase
MNRTALIEQIRKKRSFLCVGLDTDFNLIPQQLKDFGPAVGMSKFNQRIIDATAEYAVAYKPNLGFYLAQGSEGMEALEETVIYLKEKYPDIFVITDGKSGDISNSAEMYAKGLLKNMDADAVTVNPYMGRDAVEPFLKQEGKWAIILALTSNKGSEDFQTPTEGGFALYEKVLLISQHWGTPENTMYVVGATKAEMLKGIRDIVPYHFLLVPGVGAQGGSLEEVALFGMNEDCGLLVNSSREIIYAIDRNKNYQGWSKDRFAEAAGLEAAFIQNQMAGLLERYSGLKP